jgi:hypothetical protein
MLRFEFEYGTFQWFYYYTFVRVENHVCLSHGVQEVGVTWLAAMSIVAGVGYLVQRTGDGQAQVRYLVAGQLGGRVTPCTVCTMHIEMRSAGVLVEPQNQGRRFPCLVLKTDSHSLVMWASKSPRRVSWWSLKTKVDGFPGLGLKTGLSSLVN